MKLISQVESKKIGCRKYTMGVFLCDCGDTVIRIKRDGLKAKYCTRKCAGSKRGMRGSYKPEKRIFNRKYAYIYMPEHPHATGTRKLYVAEHRLKMEAKIGRYLTPDEVVHHINENTLDNRICNLRLMTASEHSRHHANERARKKDGSFK